MQAASHFDAAQKRVHMKLLHIAGLTLLLVLAGCATPQAPEKAATAPEAASAPSAPAVIPSGPLQPITAAEAASRGVAQLQPPADL